jgi:pyridinium-3,5-biscarboxylic acid mononucleotide sulfurtransferase
MASDLIRISSPDFRPPLDDPALFAKQASVLDSLGRLPSVLIAFSGGADSAYLAWAANRALGRRALSVTALSASFSEHDREIAERFVRAHSLRHEFIETREFSNPLYVANNADRCYHCKDELFAQMEGMAVSCGFSFIAYGINADDARDFRPGHRAAREHCVLSPLLDANLSKNELRRLSRIAGLETWNRPASPCLSSRIPYGTHVSPELLSKVERAESAVRRLGFRQFRVRAFGEHASIELPREDLSNGLSTSASGALVAAVVAAGFSGASIDPKGYRQGSLNALLKRGKG